MSQNPDIQLCQFKEKSVNPMTNNDYYDDNHEDYYTNEEEHDFIPILTREVSTIYNFNNT